MKTERKVADIVVNEDLYPRTRMDPAKVQEYAENIALLPPIEIDQHNRLIDGCHRLRAHETQNQNTIRVIVTQTDSDTHLLELAIERNSTHGMQLSMADKKRMAVKIYDGTDISEQAATKARLVKILSIGDRTLARWTVDLDRARVEERNRRILDLHLACWTQDEIAEAVGLGRPAIEKIMILFANWQEVSQSAAALAQHEAEFDVPLYTEWTFGKKSNAVEHFGNTEQTIVDNLLYMYTKPFDIVVDPFAGGGATIDVCRKRLRRFWASDRLPIPARGNDIRRHDVMTDGVPNLPKGYAKDVALVYLDPPYWRQSAGKYSKDATDLANMSREEFTEAMVKFINACIKAFPNARVAMIMQATQWNAEDRRVVDHILDICPGVNGNMHRRMISVPYSTQQCTPQMVEWAKANRDVLEISRRLVIWEKQHGQP